MGHEESPPTPQPRAPGPGPRLPSPNLVAAAAQGCLSLALAPPPPLLCLLQPHRFFLPKAYQALLSFSPFWPPGDPIPPFKGVPSPCTLLLSFPTLLSIVSLPNSPSILPWGHTGPCPILRSRREIPGSKPVRMTLFSPTVGKESSSRCTPLCHHGTGRTHPPGTSQVPPYGGRDPRPGPHRGARRVRTLRLSSFLPLRAEGDTANSSPLTMPHPAQPLGQPQGSDPIPVLGAARLNVRWLQRHE